MSEFNIEVAGGSSVRLLTAGKYCDRDIIVTATGGGGEVGGLSQYVKFIATPEAKTSFTIINPLGGIAKKVNVIMTPYKLTSARRCRKYFADYDLGIAVGEYSDTDSNVLYASRITTDAVGNGKFKIDDGKIILYQFNAANGWEVTSEYEVEIWQ